MVWQTMRQATRAKWLVRNWVSRRDVVAAAIAQLNAQCYLEIGLFNGRLFRKVTAPLKLGVDPVVREEARRGSMRGDIRYFEKTSDAFFHEDAAIFREHPIDVAFVDGLHTYEQVYQDVANCLKYLQPWGIVFCHDCNPRTRAIATPAASYEEAAGMRLPGWTKEWSGDVWKTIVRLRSTERHTDAFVLDTDCGIGVVTRSQGEANGHAELPYSAARIEAMDFDDLAADGKRLLGLRPPLALFPILRRLREKKAQCQPQRVCG